MIRASLADDPTFDAVLRQVRERTITAIDHQHFPFPLLVERLQPKRDPSRSPLVQADFSLAQTPPAFRDRAAADAGRAGRSADSGSALDFERFALAEEEGQFDLGLHVIDDDGPLVARFKYNADLFEAETMARMAESFTCLLEAIVANPKEQIGALRLLADGRASAADRGGHGAIGRVPGHVRAGHVRASGRAHARCDRGRMHSSHGAACRAGAGVYAVVCASGGA